MQGLLPDVITYRAVISACRTRQMAVKALLFFVVMHVQEVPPDVITYAAVISACWRA